MKKKKKSEAEDGSRNIPLTTNLVSLTNLFGLSIKAGKIQLKKKKKFDVSMPTVERVP